MISVLETLRVINAILEKHGIDPESQEPIPPQVLKEIGAAAEIAAIRDFLSEQGR